jgi:hypothetical protein
MILLVVEKILIIVLGLLGMELREVKNIGLLKINGE